MANLIQDSLISKNELKKMLVERSLKLELLTTLSGQMADKLSKINQLAREMKATRFNPLELLQNANRTDEIILLSEEPVPKK